MSDLQYSFLVRKRGRGSYQLILSYKGKDGKWHQKSKGGYPKASLASVASEKAKLLSAVEGMMSVEKGHEDITLSDFLTIYADDRKIRPSTKHIYQCSIQALGKTGSAPMRDITLGGVKKCLADSELAISTKNIIITTLRTLFSSAHEDYAFIPENPLKKLKRYKEKSKISGYKVLSNEELQLLLKSSAENDQFHLIIALGAYAGLRIGEIYGLTIGDIDLKKGNISVNKQLTLSKFSKPAFAPTKTQSSNRVIPIPPKLISILRRYIASQKVISMDGRLIVSCYPEDFRKWMRGLVGKSPHSLRHTYITNLIANGIDVKTVAALAGDTPVTILNHYVHYTDRMREKAKEDVQRIFG